MDGKESRKRVITDPKWIGKRKRRRDLKCWSSREERNMLASIEDQQSCSDTMKKLVHWVIEVGIVEEEREKKSSWMLGFFGWVESPQNILNFGKKLNENFREIDIYTKFS